MHLPAFALLRRVLLLLCGLLMLAAAPARADDDFLDPELAFKFSAHMVDGHTLAVTYQIADGYYMYRERFKFAANGATLGTPNIPAGKIHFDETFQKNVETYRKSVTITIPVNTAGAFTLSSTAQGCSDKGLCYSPQEAKANLVGSGSVPLPAGGATAAPAAAATVAGSAAAPAAAAPATAAVADGSAPVTPGVTIRSIPKPETTDITPQEAPPVAAAPASDANQIESALKGGKLLAILPVFAALGLLLSLTPCMYPMYPILMSIILGDKGRTSRGRGLLLASSYSLGMALVYTALGVAAGLAGESLAAALQNPWVLGAFALLMAALALSMFGFYELQMPSFIQEKLTGVSSQQASGKLLGVFVMGAISTLVVGPCVAPGLAGALLYISQTRDVVIGGSALFSMAVGMSVPLLVIGASSSVLPRAGAWMEAVKRFFGVVLLATGWWLVSPVLPGAVQMLGWVALFTGYGVYLLMHQGAWLAKTAGLVFAVLGVVQLVGVVSGGRDPLAPLAHLGGGSGEQQKLAFKRIKTVAQLDAELANTGGKTAILDFYADWCVSCKEMEKLTFIEPKVRDRLSNTVLLQVDVTANDEDDKAMLKRFKLFGPPGIILFNTKGQEISDGRVIGFQEAPKFLASLARLN